MVSVETANIDTIPAVSLEQRRDTLHARLETGFKTIEHAAQSGQNVSRWEQAWLDLLHEYEDVCDQIARRQSFSATRPRELALSAY